MDMVKKCLQVLFQGGILQSNERTWREAFLYFIPFLFVVVFFCIPSSGPRDTLKDYLTNDGHAISAMNLAYVDAFCGHTMSYAQKMSSETPTNVGMNQLMSKEDLALFCSNVKLYIHNEKSLSYLLSALFKFSPDITISQIGTVFNFIKITSILIFCLILFRLGMSPFFIFLSAILSIMCVFQTNMTHNITIYSFFIPLFLGYLSTFSILVDFMEKHAYKILPILCVIGFYAAFYSNWRTAHTPVIFGVFFVAIISFFIKCSFTKRNVMASLLAIGVFASGWGLFDLVFLKNDRALVSRMEKTFNYTFHSISHPLVLALGLVDDELAKNEGIRWDDSVGASLAQKVDPEATYLGKTYEKALFIYYGKLWMEHPAEMLRIYHKKYKNAASFKPYFIDVPDAKGKGWIFYRSMKIVKKIFSYFEYAALPFLMTMLSLVLIFIKRREMSLLGLFLSLSVVVSLLMFYIESLIIMHHFTLNYHSILLLLYFLMIISYLQLGINKLLTYIKDKKISSSITPQPKAI